MTDAAGYTLERVILTGELVTAAPLHIGSGFDSPCEDGADGRCTEPCVDRDGLPYIPGSSLRGLLCALLAHWPDAHRRICGRARAKRRADRPEETQDLGNAGALRIGDARLLPASVGEPVLERRVRIDPITGTAADRLLFATRLVPAGARFRCRLELDRVDDDDLQCLLGALRGLDQAPGIGAGRALRQGRLRWDPQREQVQCLRRDDFRAWLCADAEASLIRRFTTPSRPAARSLPVTAGLALTLAITPDAPLLVSPERDRRARAPDLRWRRDGDDALIPASSLKGMLRGRARRILLTRLVADWPALDDQTRAAVADDLLGEVFGAVHKQGARMARLWIGPATGRVEMETDVHPQCFTAIDRFTGGVAGSKLYQIEAVMPAELTFPLQLQPALLVQDMHWALGLLVLLLRDAMEGDLGIGWGRARGLGAIRIAPRLADGKQPADWTELLDWLDHGRLGIKPEAPDVWLQALEQQLSRRVSELSQGSETSGADATTKRPIQRLSERASAPLVFESILMEQSS